MALYITRDRFLERSRLTLKKSSKKSKLTKNKEIGNKRRRVVKKKQTCQKKGDWSKRSTLVKKKKQTGQKK